MTNERFEKPSGEANNPKEGANSGVSKSSSTTADEGPNTTQATPSGKSIVSEGKEGKVSPETGGKNSE